jgi:hypothetical protein
VAGFRTLMVLAVSDKTVWLFTMQYNSELNALPIADVFTKITGIDTKSCGTDCLEPEDLSVHFVAIRAISDCTRTLIGHIASFKSITV